MQPSITLEDYSNTKPSFFLQNTVQGVLSMIASGVPVGLRDPSGVSLFVNHLKYQANQDPLQASLVVINYVEAFGEEFLLSMPQALSQLPSSFRNNYSFWLIAAWAQSQPELEECLSGVSYFRFSGEVKDSRAKHGRKVKEEYDVFVWLAAVHLENTPAFRNQWEDRIAHFKQNAVSPLQHFLVDLLLLEKTYEDTDGETEYLPNYEALEWSSSFTAQNFKEVVSQYPVFQGLVTNAFVRAWTFLSEKPRSFCDGALEDVAFFLQCLADSNDFNAVWKNSDAYERSRVEQSLRYCSPAVHQSYLKTCAASLNEDNYKKVLNDAVNSLNSICPRQEVVNSLFQHYQKHCESCRITPLPQLQEYFRLLNEVKPLVIAPVPTPGLSRF